jgi:hypothetical protein
MTIKIHNISLKAGDGRRKTRLIFSFVASGMI